ncbi:HU family DNA-binding protein [Parabacteroides sp. GYB001]|uniref:HU family DNA-binding protein n=1 Tax=Parabacteroides leei TaxID=2939491 RepID=UPI0020180F4F|nr:HU family DNA-binding protein [Parabacteroides leei]MCL3852971.1 HU family DNA-binding protein [Parabacteroides leei]
MNKTKFIAELAERTGRPVTETHKFVEEFFALVTEVLAREEDVAFLGFGRFYIRKQSARLVRNPKTGTPVMLDERTTVRFRVGKYLFETVNRK